MYAHQVRCVASDKGNLLLSLWAPRNELGGLRFQICDFGTSRWTQCMASTGPVTYETKRHLGIQMSLPWAAPEVGNSILNEFILTPLPLLRGLRSGICRDHTRVGEVQLVQMCKEGARRFLGFPDECFVHPMALGELGAHVGNRLLSFASG